MGCRSLKSYKYSPPCNPCMVVVKRKVHFLAVNWVSHYKYMGPDRISDGGISRRHENGN